MKWEGGMGRRRRESLPVGSRTEGVTFPPGSTEPDLAAYVKVLRRRKWTIAVVTVILVGTAVGVSMLQEPIYQSTARLLIPTQDRSSIFNPTTGQRNDPRRAVESELLVLDSEPVRSGVRQRLGTAPPISATAIGDADGVEVTAESPDAGRSAAVANAYAGAYIEFRRRQGTEGLLEAGHQITEKLAQFQAELEGLDAEIGNANMAEDANATRGLIEERDSLVQQQALFKQRLDELQVEASLVGGDAVLLTPAPVPTSPVSPRPMRDALLAMAAGLFLGVGLALLREHLDDSINTKEDVDTAAGGIPVLGLVPAVPSWRDRSNPMIVSLAEPASPAAESYRSLRTAIQFLGFEHPVGLMQVTSPSSSEGKTTTLANLAVALARAGQHVAVVCCDLRRPRLHEFFALPNAVGFTSVLMGGVAMPRAVQRVPGVDRLCVLSSGPVPPNPSELLASQRTADVLGSLQADFDVVLLDCPPVLPVTDAAVLSAMVDASLLVTTAGATRKRELARAVELLRQVDAPLVGVVLNGADEQGAYGYGYGYGGASKVRARRRRHDPRHREARIPAVGAATEGR